MNTLEYLQFFEHLTEKVDGSFSMIRQSSKISPINELGESMLYYCDFKFPEGTFIGKGISRKEALKELYRKISYTKLIAKSG